MLEYIEKINEIKPYAFSIVDTYGLLNDTKLANYFNLLNNNLDESIRIGYHAHNNFQLAFSNSMKFLELETKRTIVVDATVYGMGKSAGNCADELIMMHMNKRYDTNYDIDQVLEILDTDLMSIYQKYYWGYKYNFYISAMQNCHPNYVQYLLDKKTLSISAVNEILSNIPKRIKLLYDESYIENAYVEYQSHSIYDEDVLISLSKLFWGRNIVVLGPGSSLHEKEKEIKRYIRDNESLVISVNFEPSAYDCNFVFVSNAKRYSKLADVTDKVSYAKLITTSNITLFDRPADFVLNYKGLLEFNSSHNDNALLLCLAALVKAGVHTVNLVGFDGFSSTVPNYYDSKYSFAGNDFYKVQSNEIIIKGLEELTRKINIVFLTHSIYEEALR
jgi:4-hydroxy 2-oxovalerate aldolase